MTTLLKIYFSVLNYVLPVQSTNTELVKFSMTSALLLTRWLVLKLSTCFLNVPTQNSLQINLIISSSLPNLGESRVNLSARLCPTRQPICSNFEMMLFWNEYRKIVWKIIFISLSLFGMTPSLQSQSVPRNWHLNHFFQSYLRKDLCYRKNYITVYSNLCFHHIIKKEF